MRGSKSVTPAESVEGVQKPINPFNGNGKRLAIFFFYDNDGIVDRYVDVLLNGLTEVIDDFVVVVNGILSPDGRERFKAYTQHILVRDNVGSELNLIPWEYYKLGEWFLGCILLLYMGYPLVHKFLKRFPKTAVGCFCVMYMASLYAIRQQIPYIGSSIGLTICACEMFFGMAYIRFGLHRRKNTIYASMAIFILALLLGDKIPVDFLTLALAFLILEVVMIPSERIQSDTVKKKLMYASSLTYPIFLVHHFLSDRMVQGFELANMPRLYVYVLFAAFVAATLILAYALKKYGDLFAAWMRKRKTVIAIVMVLLLLSYVYTAYRVVQYSSHQYALQIPANIQMI